MKTAIKSIILGTLVLVASCRNKDLMDPKPTTSIPDINAFDTPDKVLSQVRALYANLKGGQFYGGRYLIYNDIRAEEFLNELTNGVTALQTWNHSLTNTVAEVNGLWAQGFYTINTCNVFLDGMTAKGTSVVGDALSKNYTAEARLIRALSYYSLLQLYARPYWDGSGGKDGLPLRLVGNKTSGDYKLARSTVAQIYDQIFTDINYAETNLPVTYSTAALNTTRAHRNTAIALKTRIYLSMRKYPEAVTEANKIVSATAPFTATSGVNHSLQADITNVFKSPYTTTESIFSLPMSSTSGDNPGTQNQLGYYYSPTAANGGVGNGEYSLNPSGIIGDAYFTTADKRRTAFVKSSGTTTIKYWLTKYAAASPYTDYVPVIRYSEVLLNLAEAKVRANNAVDAQSLALLNAVHQRSDPATTLAPATVADFITAILKERRIEFLGEGLRSPDLLRLGLTIPGKSTTSGSAPAVQSTDKAYIWPISSTELDLNKLCVDNN